MVAVKDVPRMALAERVDEAEEERGNDDALAGIVIHKRRGKGSPAAWYVTMAGTDLLSLVTGSPAESPH